MSTATTPFGLYKAGNGLLVRDLHLFLNGSPVDAIQLDTTQAATDTIDYVVTGVNCLTATSTRIVIIEPAQSPSIVPSGHSATSSSGTSPSDATATSAASLTAN